MQTQDIKKISLVMNFTLFFLFILSVSSIFIAKSLFYGESRPSWANDLADKLKSRKVDGFVLKSGELKEKLNQPEMAIIKKELNYLTNSSSKEVLKKNFQTSHREIVDSLKELRHDSLKSKIADFQKMLKNLSFEEMDLLEKGKIHQQLSIMRMSINQLKDDKVKEALFSQLGTTAKHLNEMNFIRNNFRLQEVYRQSILNKLKPYMSQATPFTSEKRIIYNSLVILMALMALGSIILFNLKNKMPLHLEVPKEKNVAVSVKEKSPGMMESVIPYPQAIVDENEKIVWYNDSFAKVFNLIEEENSVQGHYEWSFIKRFTDLEEKKNPFYQLTTDEEYLEIPLTVTLKSKEQEKYQMTVKKKCFEDDFGKIHSKYFIFFYPKGLENNKEQSLANSMMDPSFYLFYYPYENNSAMDLSDVVEKIIFNFNLRIQQSEIVIQNDISQNFMIQRNAQDLVEMLIYFFHYIILSMEKESDSEAVKKITLLKRVKSSRYYFQISCKVKESHYILDLVERFKMKSESLGIGLHLTIFKNQQAHHHEDVMIDFDLTDVYLKRVVTNPSYTATL